MAKKTWLRGAALVLIAAVALAGCSKKDGSSGGGTAKASNIKEAPASDFSYELTKDKTGVVIKNYTGKGGKVAIPATIEDMPVTEIDGAFNYMLNAVVTEVVVPAGVTKMWGSFNDNKNLTKVTLPDSVKDLQGKAFYNCRALTTVNLPASLEIIREETFQFCVELNNLIIPDSLSSVKFMDGNREKPNNDAFKFCGKLPLATRSRLEALGYKGDF